MTAAGKRGTLPPVGRIIPFRRPRWTRSRDYGHRDPRKHVTVGGVARETVGWLRAFRPFILGAILLSVWPAMDARLAEPPEILSTGPEIVAERFSRCGRGRSHACVVDGDTFRLGERRIRIIGIDAPEVDARCADEARVAEQATLQLLASLNAGPFEMRAWAHNRRDRYGRELMALTRVGDERQSIAEELRTSGVARRYAGRLRGGWC